MEGLRLGTRSFEVMDVSNPVRSTTRIKRIELYSVRAFDRGSDFVFGFEDST